MIRFCQSLNVNFLPVVDGCHSRYIIIRRLGLPLHVLAYTVAHLAKSLSDWDHFCYKATSIKWLKARLYLMKKKKRAFILKLGIKMQLNALLTATIFALRCFTFYRSSAYPVQGVKYVLNIQINIKMHKDYNSLGNTVWNLGLKVLELNKDTSVCKLLKLLPITFVEKMFLFFPQTKRVFFRSSQYWFFVWLHIPFWYFFVTPVSESWQVHHDRVKMALGSTVTASDITWLHS